MKVAVHERTNKKCILQLSDIAYGDEYLSDYFDFYNRYIPEEHQALFVKEILNKQQDIDPILLRYFLTYLAEYIQTQHQDHDYFTIIDNQSGKETFEVRLPIDGIIHQISTHHLMHRYSEHRDDHMHDEHVKLIAETSPEKYNRETNQYNWKYFYRKIKDGDQLKTDTTTLTFKGKYANNYFLSIIEDVSEMCAFAIQQDLKIQTNIQWEVLDAEPL